MEILHEINPALEALAYLGSRANGHTLDRLEERLQARGVRKAEPFHRASAATRMKNITASACATPFQLLPMPFVLKMCRASISVL